MFPCKAPVAAPAPLCPTIPVARRNRPRSTRLASALGVATLLALASAAPLRAAAVGAGPVAPLRAAGTGPAASVAAMGDTCVSSPTRSASAASNATCTAASASSASVAVPGDTCVATRARPAEASPCRPVDSCRTRPVARPRAADAGDPFLAAALGALPIVSGFYVSESPIKGAAFTLADLMLIGAIIQIRSDANRPPKDAAPYYWLLAGVNLADAVLSALQVESDAAKRLSVNVNPSDRPGIILGWRF